MKIEQLACAASNWLATPFAIVVQPVATLLSVWMFGAEGPLLAISILALTFSQLVLLASATETRALQAKLDELLRALPEASDEIIGLEKKAANDPASD